MLVLGPNDFGADTIPCAQPMSMIISGRSTIINGNEYYVLNQHQLEYGMYIYIYLLNLNFITVNLDRLDPTKTL